MKKLSLIVMVLLSFSLQAQDLRTVDNTAFKPGEFLKYKVYYHSVLTGKLTAGYASLSVDKELVTIAKRPTYHIRGLGETAKAYNWFFKVDDRYETYIDTQTLAPWLFIRRVKEGDYTASQDVTYNQYKKKALFKDNKRKKQSILDIPAYTHDIISAFYYARNMDFTNLKVNDEFPIQFMFDDSVYTSKIVYVGKANVKTKLGTFRCLKFKPMVLTGSVFKDPYPMTLYISDDENRIPVLAESKIYVGSVKLELITYKGLANPASALIKKKRK